MSDNRIHTFDLLRPKQPAPERPQTNEPVSVHVLDDKETILFGTGFESSVETLIDHLNEFGGPDVIIVEHGDPDHYAAIGSLLEAFDATVAIPAEDAAALNRVDVTPDVELGHDEERWGIRTISVPGHTAGNMSFIHEDSRTLFVGDTVVHTNSFAAAPGDWSGSFAPIKPSLNADDKETRRNIPILTEYDFDMALLTHGLNVYENARAELDTLVDDLAEE